MGNKVYQPIETEIGILRGRDTLFLAENNGMNLRFYPKQLEIKGQINGTNASRNPTGQDFTYALTFYQVQALKLIGLDSWLDSRDFKGPSCFDRVLNSNWVARLKGKVTSEHQHYVLQTYDDVFEVVCESFSLKLWPDDGSAETKDH